MLSVVINNKAILRIGIHKITKNVNFNKAKVMKSFKQKKQLKKLLSNI